MVMFKVSKMPVYCFKKYFKELPYTQPWGGGAGAVAVAGGGDINYTDVE
jgi:hypothetical protein